jgi:hypothetical protein
MQSAPGALISGWLRLAGQSKVRTLSAILSSSGFILATFSAVIALLLIAFYPSIRNNDSLVRWTFRSGILLSVAGLLLGAGGMWRKSELRWHAPVSALGTSALWLICLAYYP